MPQIRRQVCNILHKSPKFKEKCYIARECRRDGGSQMQGCFEHAGVAGNGRSRLG
jgi:hypothetical protein